MDDVFVGVDLGTGGARVAVCDSEGRMVAGASSRVCRTNLATEPGHSEQDPLEWRRALLDAVAETMRSVPAGYHVAGVSVDSTSGTILPVDGTGSPLHNALMHNDVRASAQTARVNELLGGGFKATFALPKILWLMDELPELCTSARFIHATDYVTGLLTADTSMTDYSSAFKTGYDVERMAWPEAIETELGLSIERLPSVVPTATVIGETSGGLERETGLPSGTPVVAGCTDSVAAFYASGASSPGDWSSTLGTVLAVKGIATERVNDPLGRFYNHRHPDEYWLPGGASNSGAEGVSVLFGDDVQQLAERVNDVVPTSLIVYPLMRRGERLPFVDTTARGFIVGDLASRAELYAAYLEGLAFVERWVYELLETLGAPVAGCVYSTGGGALNDAWCSMRATVLGKQVARTEIPESAMGAAVLAAAGTAFGSVERAARAMVRISNRFDPDKSLTDRYDEKYARFRDEAARRGYS